jgi:hypothetical protein
LQVVCAFSLAVKLLCTNMLQTKYSGQGGAPWPVANEMCRTVL